MTPQQAASLVSYLRMIADPFAVNHVVKWASWLVDVLAVAGGL